jgi:hypothetical protein
MRLLHLVEDLMKKKNFFIYHLSYLAIKKLNFMSFPLELGCKFVISFLFQYSILSHIAVVCNIATLTISEWKKCLKLILLTLC